MQKEIISLFWKYSKPYSKRRWFVLFHAAFTILLSAFIGPYLLSKLFEQLQAGSISVESSWSIIIMYAITQIYGEIIGWRLTLFAQWTFETAAQRDLFNDIFKKLSNESLDFHANRFGGSLVSQTGKLTGSFERFWDTIVFQAIPITTSIFAATIILWTVFWQYALFLFTVSVIFAITVFFGSRFMRERNKLEAQANTAMTGRLADMVTNVMTVKAYGNERRESVVAGEYSKEWREKSLSTMRGFLTVSSIYSTLNVSLTVAALFFAIIASERSLISIGTVYLALTYTLNVSRQLWEMNGIMRNYNRIMGDAYDMTEILNLPIKVADKTSKKLVAEKGAIDFSHVSFAHDDGKGIHIFNDFSLSIPAGKHIGLVGHSGSGKSTLVRLLLRFSDIDSGSIRIDDQDIVHVNQKSLRQSIAYVPQEPMLFHRSLRENISYGKLDATDEEIIEAAKKANAWEFITTLSDGLDTMVGERGVKLSGGQRQRIAIARAILKDAPVLVLDEATSALDSESERLIQDALKKLMEGRTSIVIAHRLSTISQLDTIVVLDNGTIVESGSHQELLAKRGTYAKLWAHQSGGFLEDD